MIEVKNEGISCDQTNLCFLSDLPFVDIFFVHLVLLLLLKCLIVIFNDLLNLFWFWFQVLHFYILLIISNVFLFFLLLLLIRILTTAFHRDFDAVARLFIFLLRHVYDLIPYLLLLLTKLGRLLTVIMRCCASIALLFNLDFQFFDIERVDARHSILFLFKTDPLPFL